MPYVQRNFIAGNSIIVQKGYKTEKQAGKKRAKKENATKEAVKRMNERYATHNLTVLMNANFSIGDLHIVWTYRKEERPTPEVAQKYLTKAIKDLRKVYRKAGQELKYIYTTEYKNGAIHHHILLNYFDIRKIASVWKYGMTRPTVVYTNDLSKLASYFVKETQKTFKDDTSPTKQRYIPSKNLAHPEPQEEIVHSKHWAKEPKPIAGYEIVKDSVENGVNEITGFPWQYYIMTVVDTEQVKKPRKPRKSKKRG